MRYLYQHCICLQGIYQCFAVTMLGEVNAAGEVVIVPDPLSLPYPSDLTVGNMTDTSADLRWRRNAFNNASALNFNVAYVVFYGRAGTTIL